MKKVGLPGGDVMEEGGRVEIPVEPVHQLALLLAQPGQDGATLGQQPPHKLQVGGQLPGHHVPVAVRDAEDNLSHRSQGHHAPADLFRVVCILVVVR